MSDFIFKISPNIILGSYTATRLGQHASEWGSKFMLVIDPILKESGTTEKLTKSLSERGIDYFVFDEIPSSANSETLEAALKLARDSHAHGVIAAGGGRTLAIAKGVCALAGESKNLYDYIDGEIPTSKPLPLICVPTTLRDSFIFTDRSPITDGRSSKLKMLKTQNGVCRLVLWDPQLQLTLTEKQSACQSIEVLSYAIEGYLSQKSNFFSDMIIEKAVQFLSYALDGNPSISMTTPQEVLLTQAGCMSSIGAAASSFGAANLLSYAINSRFKISRSLSTPILLPYIIEDATTFRADKLASLARLLRSCPQDAPDKDAVDSISEYVRQKIAKVNIPARLKDLSLSIEQLALAVEDAGDLDMMNSLPRSMTTDDLFDIVKKAY